MSDETEETLACVVRVVTAPDGVEIPVPVGGVGLAGGSVGLRAGYAERGKRQHYLLSDRLRGSSLTTRRGSDGI